MPIGGGRILIGSAIVLVLVAAEECSQLWVIARTSDFYDLLFDVLGIYLGGALASKNMKMKRGACA